VPLRKAYIIESSLDLTKHLCIDAENEGVIMDFIKADGARIKKLRLIKSIILEGLRNTELYDKEDINDSCGDVTAMKMFKGGQNVRIYCKEQRIDGYEFCIIMAELLPKKKDKKVKGKTKNLINKVSTYEYYIEDRESNSAEN